jgi:hypothetical protein
MVVYMYIDFGNILSWSVLKMCDGQTDLNECLYSVINSNWMQNHA